jgi:hypothetical protein
MGHHALVGGQIVQLRVPYPMGFFTKGLEGRIDDRNAGWKGRALWATSGNRTPQHIEGIDAPAPGAPGPPRKQSQAPWSSNSNYAPTRLHANPMRHLVMRGRVRSGLFAGGEWIRTISSARADTDVRM